MYLRLVLLCMGLLTGTGLLLVHTQYQVRQLFIGLETAEGQARELDVQWAQLQGEQSVLSQSARVVEIAKNSLQMLLPEPAQTYYFDMDAPSGARMRQVKP